MKTKIINISDDQNNILHESGILTEFVEIKDNEPFFQKSIYGGCCGVCIYRDIDNCKYAPCCMADRNDDTTTGYWKLLPNH